MTKEPVRGTLFYICEEFNRLDHLCFLSVQSRILTWSTLSRFEYETIYNVLEHHCGRARPLLTERSTLRIIPPRKGLASGESFLIGCWAMLAACASPLAASPTLLPLLERAEMRSWELKWRRFLPLALNPLMTPSPIVELVFTSLYGSKLAKMVMLGPSHHALKGL